MDRISDIKWVWNMGKFVCWHTCWPIHHTPIHQHIQQSTNFHSMCSGYWCQLSLHTHYSPLNGMPKETQKISFCEENGELTHAFQSIRWQTMTEEMGMKFLFKFVWVRSGVEHRNKNIEALRHSTNAVITFILFIVPSFVNFRSFVCRPERQW